MCNVVIWNVSRSLRAPVQHAPAGAVTSSSWCSSKLTGTITKCWHVMSSRLLESQRVANTIRPDRRVSGAYADGAGPANQHLVDRSTSVFCKPTVRNETLGSCSLEFPASFPDWLCRSPDVRTPVSIECPGDMPTLKYCKNHNWKRL